MTKAAIVVDFLPTISLTLVHIAIDPGCIMELDTWERMGGPLPETRPNVLARTKVRNRKGNARHGEIYLCM